MKSILRAHITEEQARIEFGETIRRWLTHTLDNLRMAGGRKLGTSEWVQGRHAEVYIRFQYKVIDRKEHFCIVLSNIRSRAPGNGRVAIANMMDFCNLHGFTFYVENVLSDRIKHLCEVYMLEEVYDLTQFGLPCYYKAYS